MLRSIPIALGVCLLGVFLCRTAGGADGTEPDTDTAAAGDAPEPPAPPAAPEDAPAVTRASLNTLGRAETAEGESRRNENIQFNLIDNNAFKEAAIRLGTSATLIREFSPESSYFGAELGAPPESAVSVPALQRTGFHGSARWMHLNSQTSARSFFQAGPVQPARENDYGFDVTRLLWRGAAFTARGGQQKIRGNVNGNVLVPRADERTPLALDPEERAVVERMLSVFPDELPNRTDINERALNTNAPQIINDNSASARLDQNWGNGHRVGLDYGFFSQQVDAFQLIGAQNPDTTTRTHRARIAYSRNFSGARTLDLTAAFDRVGSLLTEEEGSIGFTVFVSSALSNFGYGSGIPIDRAQNTFRYNGLYRFQQGRHELTVGGQAQRRQINGFEADSHLGVYTFNAAFGNDAVTNFRLGRAGAFYQSIGDVHRGFRDWDGVAFVGDRWRPLPNLDLNLGLRFRMIGRPIEVNGLNRVPYSCDCNNLAPTFGFAYRLPEGSGVLRGGFGIHYGSIFPVTYQQARYNPPGNTKVVVQAPDLLDPLGGLDLTQAGGGPSVLYALDPNLVSPYSMQYNLSWDTEPAAGWNLSLGYVGSRSPKLLQQRYENRAEMVPGIAPILDTVNLRRPNPDLLDERAILNGSRGYFDAGKVALRAPAWRGFSIDASYWFSKILDLGTDYTNTASNEDAFRSRSQSVRDVHRDMKGRARFDQPHAALARISYQTPRFGAGGSGGSSWLQRLASSWLFSTVTLFKSGTPFNVETGSDAPGFGNVDGVPGERPHILDPAILGRAISHPDTSQERLPRSAFAFIGPGESGTLGRHVFRKGPIRNVNAALSRRFTLGGDAWMVFRAESVNLLNTPQFAEPGSRLVDPNFGAITNTLNEGRTFRFGLEAGF